MNRKIDLLYGFLIGVAASFIGAILFVLIFTNYDPIDGLQIIRANGQLGNLLKLGALLNLIIFFVMLRYDRDMMARGIIVTFFFLTITSFFI